MKVLQNQRTIPEGSLIYFSVHLPERGEHRFRIPRPSVVGRLLTPLLTSGVWKLGEGEAGSITSMQAELVEEAVGAALGTCWRHLTLELESKRRDFDRGDEGLLDYGESVVAELYEAGYKDDDIKRLLDEVLSRLLIAIPAPPKEVQELVDFTAPRTDSKTSSTSI